MSQSNIHSSFAVVVIPFLRPHNAAGTTKALQDAMALGNLCENSQASWKDVCVKYNEERKKEADSLVKLGARLGEFQVVNTPDWGI